MPAWWSGRNKNSTKAEVSFPATLERKTAEITARLSRLSAFRRHSAPAREPAQERESPRENQSATIEDECNPVALSVLPIHVLELILQHLSLQDLSRSVALTHSSWRSMAMSDMLWKGRLHDKLPRPLLTTLKLSRKPWSHQVSQFYSTNMISDATFPNSSFSGVVGRGTTSNNTWRAQVKCWRVDNPKLEAQRTASLCESCGGEDKIKILTLHTPEWCHPEASQDIDLVTALSDMGMHRGDAVDFLDTCPEIEFSVWVSCGDDQPDHWRRGFAAVVLDNGIENGAEWENLALGSQIHSDRAAAFWISWVFDDSLLRGCTGVRKGPTLTLKGRRFQKISCIFMGYNQGARRAHILLRGLDPRMVYQKQNTSGKSKAKPTAEFCAPVLRFRLPFA